MEKQNWGNVAPEPKWFPRFIPTKENGRSKDFRWTDHAVVSFCVGFLILAGAAVIPIQNAMGHTPPPKKVELGTVIPNVVGMDLQDAQECLREKGFRQIESVSDGKTRQILDRNWKVVRQRPIGPTVNKGEKVWLGVVRKNQEETRPPWDCS